jgi:hypothetical protein
MEPEEIDVASTGSETCSRCNEYTRNNGRTVRRGVIYAVNVVADTQYVVKEK